MNPIDRFTRDEASAKVWWPFALLLIVLLVLTFPGRNRAVQTERTDAAAEAAVLAQVVAEGSGGQVNAVVDASPTMVAIRTWAADGELLSSTSPDDQVGSQAALNDEFLAAATAAGGQPVSQTTETTLTGEAADPVIRVFVASSADPATIIEAELDDEALLASTGEFWLNLQIVLAAAILLVLGLALASMREPIASIGAGVKFYPASVPAGTVVLDADEAGELRQAGAYARKRIAEQQERAAALEVEKIRLEGELQRALSARPATQRTQASIPRPGGNTDADIAAPAPVGMPERAPVPEVRVLRIPDLEPEPVVAETAPEPVAEVPVTASEPGLQVPAAPVEPPPAPKPRRTPKVEPVREPVAATPRPADDSMGFVLVPDAAPVPEKAPASKRAAKPAAEVVLVPDADDDDGRHDAQVLDVLERLVEPVGTGSTADPSDMRARLARTAAAKKPGSRADERFHE